MGRWWLKPWKTISSNGDTWGGGARINSYCLNNCIFFYNLTKNKILCQTLDSRGHTEHKSFYFFSPKTPINDNQEINPQQRTKKQKHHFADKGPSSQSYGFSTSHVWMWELDHTEGWVLKNLCFQTVVLEKSPESPLDCKEIKPVNPKRNQSKSSLEGLMLKLKLQYFGHLMRKTDSFGKDPDAGKDWRQEEKGTTEDEMVEWHYRLDGHESE